VQSIFWLTIVTDKRTDTDILTVNSELNYVVWPKTNSVSYYGIMLTSHCKKSKEGEFI